MKKYSIQFKPSDRGQNYACFVGMIRGANLALGEKEVSKPQVFVGKLLVIFQSNDNDFLRNFQIHLSNYNLKLEE